MTFISSTSTKTPKPCAYKRNRGKRWSGEDKLLLSAMRYDGVPMVIIAAKLGRSIRAVKGRN